MKTIFEDFLEYCKEDNPKLEKDIKIWIADYFDLPNRVIPLSLDEVEWIKNNLGETGQVEILGYTVDKWIDTKEKLL